MAPIHNATPFFKRFFDAILGPDSAFEMESSDDTEVESPMDRRTAQRIGDIPRSFEESEPESARIVYVPIEEDVVEDAACTYCNIF